MSPRPRGLPPGRKRRGEPSANAWATPAKAFSAPGPCCTAATPRRRPLVTREYASAMFTSVRSVRGTIGRMSSRAHSSMRGLTGKQNRYAHSSAWRIFAIAVDTFMAAAPHPNPSPQTSEGERPRSLRLQAIQVLLAAQEQLLADHRRRGVDRVVETIDRQD